MKCIVTPSELARNDSFAGAMMRFENLEGVGLTRLKTRDEEHILNDSSNSASVLTHDFQESQGCLSVFQKVAFGQVFQIPIDDGEGRP